MELTFDEEFKECPFNDTIEVSQYGRVRNKKDGKFLEQIIFKGYLIVEDPKDRLPYLFESVHRLVALTWKPESYEKKKGLVAHHIDGDNFNNRADNLEWREPEEHKSDHGLTNS